MKSFRVIQETLPATMLSRLVPLDCACIAILVNNMLELACATPTLRTVSAFCNLHCGLMSEPASILVIAIFTVSTTDVAAKNTLSILGVHELASGHLRETIGSKPTRSQNDAKLFAHVGPTQSLKSAEIKVVALRNGFLN